MVRTSTYKYDHRSFDWYMTDTVERLVAVINDQLQLNWGIPPPETDVQGVTKEVN